MSLLLDFHKSVRLGKKAAKIDPRTLQLGNYFTDFIGEPPASADYTKGISSWGMMLNDNLGDCTIAAVGHAVQVLTANNLSGEGEQTIPDSTVLKLYENWCGYVPGDPSTDQGGVEIDVLNNWRTRGILNTQHALFGYADTRTEQFKEIKQAIYLFGGVYIGLQLPISAQGKNVWDISTGPDAVPGSWGGHAVFIPKYVTNPDGTTTFTAISWGGEYEITEAFWRYVDPTNGPYIDEVHALLGQDWINNWVAPQGFNLHQLEKDLWKVSQ